MINLLFRLRETSFLYLPRGLNVLAQLANHLLHLVDVFRHFHVHFVLLHCFHVLERIDPQLHHETISFGARTHFCVPSSHHEDSIARKLLPYLCGSRTSFEQCPPYLLGQLLLDARIILPCL